MRPIQVDSGMPFCGKIEPQRTRRFHREHKREILCYGQCTTYTVAGIGIRLRQRLTLQGLPSPAPAILNRIQHSSRRKWTLDSSLLLPAILCLFSFMQRLLTAAKTLGFELCGITNAEPPTHFDAFERWLQAGMNGDMTHFVRNFEARKHPESLLSGVQSILMLGVSYAAVLNSEPHRIRQLSGIVEYARGVDYHRWIRSRLEVIADKHRELFPAGRCRGIVDTAPFLEKQYAAAAGLGMVGKNTLLIHPRFGSKFFLAALLSTESFEPTPLPNMFDPCGECRRCLDACPTGALIEPFVLDSRRCLSYWTLIHRGELPKNIAEKRGSRFLGCDTCQSVCPHNQSLPSVPEGSLDPSLLHEDELRPFLVGTALEKRESKPLP